MLEPYLNYYVVNNLEEGLQAIHLLDDNKKGKANFFLLDKFTDFEERSINRKDTIPALDVIEVDEQICQSCQTLTGQCFYRRK